MSAFTNRQALIKWDEYVKNLRRETPVPVEAPDVKAKRIKRLKGNFVEFCEYYFPNYCSAPFAKFQLDAQKEIAAKENIYLCWAIAREHAKSVIMGLFVPMYEMANGRLHNMLLVSHSYDNACELLSPIMLNLEHNQRWIADYGTQRSWRGWEVGHFITNDGKSFRAIGAGQSPRGTRNEEKRPDYILIDDIDTDEESRNQTRIDKKFDWVEQALFPAMSITGSKRFIIVGNIISKESIVVKASRVADYYKKVNILDKNGNPSWAERYSIEQVNYMLSKISYASGQKEYFNNPLNEGTVFKNIAYAKPPPLQRFRLLVAYMDASYKSTASKKGDYKALVLLGLHDGKLWILKAFVEHETLANAIGWFYDVKDFAGDKATVYNYVEVNGLQDPWYQDVFLPACKKVQEEKGHYISIGADRRAKPDKFSRIEAALEPLNRLGNLCFNIDEKDNPHMQRLEEQFKAIEPTMAAHDDGPDATEGGYYIANTKLRQLAPIKAGRNRRSGKNHF